MRACVRVWGATRVTVCVTRSSFNCAVADRLKNILPVPARRRPALLQRGRRQVSGMRANWQRRLVSTHVMLLAWPNKPSKKHHGSFGWRRILYRSPPNNPWQPQSSNGQPHPRAVVVAPGSRGGPCQKRVLRTPLEVTVLLRLFADYRLPVVNHPRRVCDPPSLPLASPVQVPRARSNGQNRIDLRVRARRPMRELCSRSRVRRERRSQRAGQVSGSSS